MCEGLFKVPFLEDTLSGHRIYIRFLHRIGRLGRRIPTNKLYLGSQVGTFNPAAEFWQISVRATYRDIQLCYLVLANHRARTRGYWFWLRVPSINLVAILLIECVESGTEYCCPFGLATFYHMCRSLWRTNTDNTQLLKPGCRTFLRFFQFFFLIRPLLS